MSWFSMRSSTKILLAVSVILFLMFFIWSVSNKDTQNYTQLIPYLMEEDMNTIEGFTQRLVDKDVVIADEGLLKNNTYFFKRGVEKQIHDLFVSILSNQHDQVVVDIGANAGYYSYLSGVLGAHSYAVEPLPRCHQLIKFAKTKNKVLGHGITLVPFGASDSVSTFGVNPTVCDSSFYVKSGGQAKATAIVMDDYLLAQGETGVIDILKCDTEGFEVRSLRGMQKTLSSGNVRHIIVEIMPGLWDSSGISIEAGTKFFNSIADKYNSIVLEDEHFPAETETWSVSHDGLPASVSGKIMWMPEGKMETLIRNRLKTKTAMNIWFFKK